MRRRAGRGFHTPAGRGLAQSGMGRSGLDPLYQEKAAVIYFMQPVGGGPIKIGASIDVESRHRQLEATYGKKLKILAVMEGDYDDERKVHLRFAHLRFGRTEQFRPASDLLEFIGSSEAETDGEISPMPYAPRNGRTDSTVRMDEEVARLARMVASARGISLAEYLSEVLAPIVDADSKRAMRDMLGKID